MEFFLPIYIKQPADRISYHDKILLTGSCFTEHIGGSLDEHKFPVMQNPNGIIFDPASVCGSLISYIEKKQLTKEDLFHLNDVWNNWDYHSRYSHIDKNTCCSIINNSQEAAHEFLKQANWLIITLGTSFSYRLTSECPGSHLGKKEPGDGVANCHRAPQDWFAKTLLPLGEIISMLDDTVNRLMQFNPGLKIIFTISPVRHARDGVVENNRSKARLIEAVHHLVEKTDGLYYFPAYEIVMDVLRDYRFYDADLVHPNYAATEYVMEKFRETFIDTASSVLMDEIKKIVISRKHKPMHPGTTAHQSFLKTSLDRVQEIQQLHPSIDLSDEISYFQSSLKSL